MEIHERAGDIVIRQTVHDCVLEYSERGFTTFGYRWDPDPGLGYACDCPLDYWKAQLAFRGLSPYGSSIEALKMRLSKDNKCTMDGSAFEARQAMREEYRVRKAGGLARSLNEYTIGTDPEQFLRDKFCGEEDGKDDGASSPFSVWYASEHYARQLHDAAEALGLFHKTTVTGGIVIGSMKHELAETFVA